MKLSINAQNLILWLLIPFVSVTSHTILPIPPPMVLLFLSTFPFIFILSKQHYIYIDYAGFLIICFSLYLIISQILIGAPIYHLGAKVVQYLFYIILFFNLKTTNRKLIATLINIFINVSILIFILEFLFRFLNPSFYSSSLQSLTGMKWIYQYKSNSIMYADSNATAIHISSIFFFLFYMEGEIVIKRINLKKIILFILVVFTFSRAGWISIILGYFFVRYIKNNISLGRVIIIIIAISLVSFFLYLFYLKPLFDSDQSFKEHLSIIELTREFLKSTDFFTILFGVGVSLSKESLGIYTHNYFLTAFIETGIIGLLLDTLIFLAFIIESKGKALIVLFPFFIIVMSSNMTFGPFFYIIMALIVFYEK